MIWRTLLLCSVHKSSWFLLDVYICANFMQVSPDITGSSFLEVFDQLALEVLPETSSIITENIGRMAEYCRFILHFIYPIVVETKGIPVTGSGDYITTISSLRLAEGVGLSGMSIDIPREVVTKFASNGGGESVRTVSFLFHNVTDIFPGELPEGGNE